MPDQLHWNTVTPLLKSALTLLMKQDLLKGFRLVGGTSLSLRLGHRKSDDIDLFTEAPYNSVNFDALENFLHESFSTVTGIGLGPVGMGRSYLIGNNDIDSVKLDLFYTDPFIRNQEAFGHYRLASIDDVVAMKLDIIQSGGRKKDFWDLHELLEKYTIAEMLELHELRYPFSHDEQRIRANFIDFEKADGDFEPVCLRGKYWELIKLSFVQELAK